MRVRSARSKKRGPRAALSCLMPVSEAGLPAYPVDYVARHAAAQGGQRDGSPAVPDAPPDALFGEPDALLDAGAQDGQQGLVAWDEPGPVALLVYSVGRRGHQALRRAPAG